jgi:hypothetical protein
LFVDQVKGSPFTYPIAILLYIAVYASSTIHGDMSEQEFANAEELKAWLSSQGVPEPKATAAALILFHKDFDSPSTLKGIRSVDLQRSGLSIPLAQLLSKMVSCVAVLVFIFVVIRKYFLTLILTPLLVAAIRQNNLRSNYLRK